MKKQINPNINAHLIRGAFYLLLLVAVCAIPFALAQRNATKRPVTTKVLSTVRPFFSSTMHSHNRVPNMAARLLRPLIPNAVYMIDDGTAEDAVGFGNGSQNFESLFFNQFDVVAGQTLISTISVAWGTPAFPDPSNNGTPVTIGIWSDPNGDGNPSDAALLGQVSGTIQNEGTNTFVDYTLSPAVDVSAFTSFFVGDMTPMNNGPEHFFQGIDQNNPLHRQSWIAAMSDGSAVDFANPGNNDFIGLIDDFGLPGNWLIRADTGGAVSPTPTTTGTPTATPTGTPASCSWSAGPDLPRTGTRLVGVFFPANGKFYAMGGRSSDDPGNEFTHPFEYDPVANNWTTKSATYPDVQVNNMACGVLSDAGTPYIYCVGGSDVASQTTTGRVFRYDPVTDTLSSVGDPWPPGAATTTLPGGFSVFDNKLFILGGFDIPGGVATSDIWEFDPATGAWVQKSTTLPVPLGYIPTTTIGNLIYTGGGSDITGGVLTDTTNSFVYDPVLDSISTIAPIPRATGETRALNFCNQMYVMGGGRVAPNPSNEVDIYDPVANSWSVGTPFLNGRRNFPTDTDGTNHIWLAGGYDIGGAILSSMEIFTCPVSPCGTPSPTPTATATSTPSGTPTATATATATGTPSGTRPTPTPRARPTPAPRP